jgi:hypothetical protein
MPECPCLKKFGCQVVCSYKRLYSAISICCLDLAGLGSRPFCTRASN